MAVERTRNCILLDKPIYAGFTVLELSKLLMYEFHFNTMKRQYGSRASLLFSATDSLCYEIETEDAYVDMQQHRDII